MFCTEQFALKKKKYISGVCVMIFPLMLQPEDFEGHKGAVLGICIDGVNTLMISGGTDGLLMFWDFMSHSLRGKEEVGVGISHLQIARESGLVAAACDDFVIRCYDITVKKMVRVGKTF